MAKLSYANYKEKRKKQKKYLNFVYETIFVISKKKKILYLPHETAQYHIFQVSNFHTQLSKINKRYLLVVADCYCG